MDKYQAPYGKLCDYHGEPIPYCEAYIHILNLTEDWKVILHTRQNGSHVAIAVTASRVALHQGAFILAGGLNRAIAMNKAEDINNAYHLPRKGNRQEIIGSLF